jgi:hypothetical protein
MAPKASASLLAVMACLLLGEAQAFVRPSLSLFKAPKILPTSAFEGLFSNVTSQRNLLASSDNRVSSDCLTCAAAITLQASSASSYSYSGYSLSDATCDTCGKSGCCPVGLGGYYKLNSDLYDCVSGGDKVGYVTLCQAKPNGGLIALVIILPIFGIALITMACCFCCPCCPVHKRRHPVVVTQPVMMPGVVMQQGMVMQQPGMVMQQPGMVMQQPGVMMQPMQPVQYAMSPEGPKAV